MQISLISKLKYYFDMAALKRDQNGIMRRYLLEKEGWDYHLDKSKSTIIDNVGSGYKIAILGSGWLLDVPVETLLQRFDEIHMCDIVHPPQILHKYKGNSKIKFIQIDLTGGLISLNSKGLTQEELLETIYNNDWNIDLKGFNVVVSLNVFNQLDNLFMDALLKKHKLSILEQEKIRRKIQLSHINGLPNGRSLLISDLVEEATHTQNRNSVFKQLAFVDLPEDKLVNQWDWLFDTHGLYKKGYNITFKVKAYRL